MQGDGSEGRRIGPGVGVTTLYSNLVAEWIHFTLFWIILPTIKTESVNFFGGLMNSATKASLAAPKVRFVVQDSGLWGSEGSRCPRSRGLGFRD